ncbi:hypothetical protein AB0I81_41470 [Nonomuraea sp. NPDC050404]|uniref:hypothetical protein n=1 Tax=Nonomuraea sp. NPDC050404 TaxID=3155783 RepID=UPI0033F4CA57
MTTRQDHTDQAHPTTPAEPPTPPDPPAATPPPDPTSPPDSAPSADAEGTITSSSPQPGTADEPEDERPEQSVRAEQSVREDGQTEQGGRDGHGVRARITRAKVVSAMAAMLVAALAATAVLQWVSAAQAQDARAGLEAERALRLEVSGAAAAFSRALLGYDYRNLQSTRTTLAAQATGDFLATYDAAFGGAMAQVIVKLKATAQANVREVYVAGVDEATAHAIVVVDQQVNTSEAIRSVKDSHLKISLVKEKGTWKIHDVTVLGAASEDQYNLNDDGKKTKKD